MEKRLQIGEELRRGLFLLQAWRREDAADDNPSLIEAAICFSRAVHAATAAHSPALPFALFLDAKTAICRGGDEAIRGLRVLSYIVQEHGLCDVVEEAILLFALGSTALPEGNKAALPYLIYLADDGGGGDDDNGGLLGDIGGDFEPAITVLPPLITIPGVSGWCLLLLLGQAAAAAGEPRRAAASLSAACVLYMATAMAAVRVAVRSTTVGSATATATTTPAISTSAAIDTAANGSVQSNDVKLQLLRTSQLQLRWLDGCRGDGGWQRWVAAARPWADLGDVLYEKGAGYFGAAVTAYRKALVAVPTEVSPSTTTVDGSSISSSGGGGALSEEERRIILFRAAKCYARCGAMDAAVAVLEHLHGAAASRAAAAPFARHLGVWKDTWRQRNAREAAAALTLQCFARVIAARRACLQRRQRQSDVQKSDARRRRCLQKTGLAAFAEARRLGAARRNEAAAKIQRCCRCWQAHRAAAAVRRREQRFLVASAILVGVTSASGVGDCWRRWLAHHAACRSHRRDGAAATRMQALWRGRSACSNVPPPKQDVTALGAAGRGLRRVDAFLNSRPTTGPSSDDFQSEVAASAFAVPASAIADAAEATVTAAAAAADNAAVAEAAAAGAAAAEAAAAGDAAAATELQAKYGNATHRRGARRLQRWMRALAARRTAAASTLQRVARGQMGRHSATGRRACRRVAAAVAASACRAGRIRQAARHAVAADLVGASCQAGAVAAVARLVLEAAMASRIQCAWRARLARAAAAALRWLAAASATVAATVRLRSERRALMAWRRARRERIAARRIVMAARLFLARRSMARRRRMRALALLLAARLRKLLLRREMAAWGNYSVRAAAAARVATAWRMHAARSHVKVLRHELRRRQQVLAKVLLHRARRLSLEALQEWFNVGIVAGRAASTLQAATRGMWVRRRLHYLRSVAATATAAALTGGVERYAAIAAAAVKVQSTWRRCIAGRRAAAVRGRVRYVGEALTCAAAARERAAQRRHMQAWVAAWRGGMAALIVLQATARRHAATAVAAERRAGRDCAEGKIAVYGVERRRRLVRRCLFALENAVVERHVRPVRATLRLQQQEWQEQQRGQQPVPSSGTTATAKRADPKGKSIAAGEANDAGPAPQWSVLPPLPSAAHWTAQRHSAFYLSPSTKPLQSNAFSATAGAAAELPPPKGYYRAAAAVRRTGVLRLDERMLQLSATDLFELMWQARAVVFLAGRGSNCSDASAYGGSAYGLSCGYDSCPDDGDHCGHPDSDNKDRNSYGDGGNNVVRVGSITRLCEAVQNCAAVTGAGPQRLLLCNSSARCGWQLPAVSVLAGLLATPAAGSRLCCLCLESCAVGSRGAVILAEALCRREYSGGGNSGSGPKPPPPPPGLLRELVLHDCDVGNAGAAALFLGLAGAGAPLSPPLDLAQAGGPDSVDRSGGELNGGSGYSGSLGGCSGDGGSRDKSGGSTGNGDGASSGLRLLSLCGNRIGTAPAATAALAALLTSRQRCPAVLRLARCSVGDGDVVALAAALRHPRCSLRAISLAGNPELRNAGAIVLAAAAFGSPRLTSLDLTGCGVTAAGLRVLNVTAAMLRQREVAGGIGGNGGGRGAHGSYGVCGGRPDSACNDGGGKHSGGTRNGGSGFGGGSGSFDVASVKFLITAAEKKAATAGARRRRPWSSSASSAEARLPPLQGARAARHKLLQKEQLRSEADVA